MSLPKLLNITSIEPDSNSFRINFVAGSPPAGAHTNSVTLFVNEKNSNDNTFPIYTIFESNVSAEDDIPSSFLIELEDPPQFYVGATYVMSISQSFSDGSETVSNTLEENYILNAKPLKPVIINDASGNNVAEGDQVVSFYLDAGASQGSAVLSISGRSFNVAAGQYVFHQCPINSATLTRAGSSGTNMKVRKTIVGDPVYGANLYYCVLLNLENGVDYEHRFSTINVIGKSESCNVFMSNPTNEVLAVTGFSLDSSILNYKFTASWDQRVIPNHDDFESIVTGYKLDYEYTDASYNAVMSTFDASSNTLLAFESQPLQVAEAASGVSVVNGFATRLTSAQMTSAKADSNPTLIAAGTDRDGWTINNAGAVADPSGNFPKVNLYFYANTVAAASQTASNSFTLNQATGLGLYAIFDQAAGAREYPFFNAYTTFSGTNNRSWYKSKVFYGAQSNTGDTLANPDNVGLTLAYTGTDNAALFPHIPSARRIKYEVKVGANLTDANPGYASELMQYLTLQTSRQAASAGNYNFRLMETGMFTSHASFGQLRLLYNLTGKVAATIYATTDNSGDGARSAVHSINVFDSPMGLRPQDYTITANNKEISVNIQLNAATLAYLDNRSVLDHIKISLLDASYNPVQDASYNVLQDASGNNTLNLNHSFAALTNGDSYIVRMQLIAFNPNPSESTEVIYGDTVYEYDIVPLANSDAILVTATGSNQKVTFNWVVPTDEQLQGGTFVKYVIKYRGSSGTAVIREENNINVTSYELTGLTNGTTYYFTFYVVTLDTNTSLYVNGDVSNLDEMPFRAADAPASITLTPSNEQIQVDWSASVLNGSVFDHYLVELYNASNNLLDASGNSSDTTHTFYNLTNGTSYYARVTVYSTNPNNSSISVTGGSITSSSKIPFRVPDAPVSVILTPGDEEMQINWSPAVLNGSVFKEYLVELFQGPYGTTLTNVSTLSHTFTGLTNGTSYYGRVTVYATDPNNSSIVFSGGSTNSPSQIPFRAADAPASITLTPGDEQMQVDWSASVLNGSDFDYYHVELFSGAVGSGVPVASYQLSPSSHTFTGLTNGTSYYARVTVYSTNPNNGTSVTGGTITASSSKIPFRVPDAPVTVVATAGDRQMQIDWTPAVLNGTVFKEYLVQLFPGAYSITKTNQSTLSHTFTGLTNGTSYYGRVTVYATDPNDSSIVIFGGLTDSSSQIPFKDADAPTLATYPGYQTFRVDWSNVQLNGGSFQKYKVGLYNSTGTTLVQPEVEYTDFNQRTHTFTGLTIGVTYVAKVIVVTSDPNAGAPATEGDYNDGAAGSSAAEPHDNPIIIGSATINNASAGTKTVSVTVDKNGSNITDYMAIVKLANNTTLMQKVNNSTPLVNSDGTYTLSIIFNTTVNITSALMVVGNGGGFTAVEFNGSTQTVLSPDHYRAVANP